VAISLISGENSNQVTLRQRGLSLGASEVNATAGSAPVETRQSVKEPAAVVSDSLQRLSGRDRTPDRAQSNRTATGVTTESGIVNDAELAKLRTDVGTVASETAAMITTNAEVAVLAQAHQLPTAPMPAPFDI
jgi:hypothetical protein